MSEPVDPVAPEPAAPAVEPDAAPAAAEPAAEPEGDADADDAEPFRPVVAGPNPSHTVQEVVDWILDKIGRK